MIEAALIASGLDHTLLRNNVYMQNLLMLAPAIGKTSQFASSAGAGRSDSSTPETPPPSQRTSPPRPNPTPGANTG